MLHMPSLPHTFHSELFLNTLLFVGINNHFSRHSFSRFFRFDKILFIQNPSNARIVFHSQSKIKFGCFVKYAAKNLLHAQFSIKHNTISMSMRKYMEYFVQQFRMSEREGEMRSKCVMCVSVCVAKCGWVHHVVRNNSYNTQIVCVCVLYFSVFLFPPFPWQRTNSYRFAFVKRNMCKSCGCHRCYCLLRRFHMRQSQFSQFFRSLGFFSSSLHSICLTIAWPQPKRQQQRAKKYTYTHTQKLYIHWDKMKEWSKYTH